MGELHNWVLEDEYRDSVALMRLSRELSALPGVARVSALMGTPANLRLLEEAGLLTGEGRGARPSDIVLCAELQGARPEEVWGRARELLAGAPWGGEGGAGYRPRTLEGALDLLPGANLALISVPGAYAAAEARKALEAGLHVFLFSDNVPLPEEASLKRLARERGLFLLGPDCGTAHLDGVPLGFANEVPRGRVGVVSASGTGLQQVACLLARAGEGLSQGIGVGGRDLSEEVGGLMARAALGALARDEGTEIVLLLSKAPSPEVARELLEELAGLGKPAVCCFLGGASLPPDAKGVTLARTLGEAAERALGLLGHPPGCLAEEPRDILASICKMLPRERSDIRGLFSGGTLCGEAALIAREAGLEVTTNASVPGARPLAPHESPPGHLFLDLGDDRFTLGRPHPMIDLADRARRLGEEAERRGTGVILLDVVLGHGAHEDPARELAPAIQRARERAAVVAVLIGTEGDPQGLSSQRGKLEGAGALVFSRNDQAARAAVALARREPGFPGGASRG